MNTLPQWATPKRQLHLVALFLKYQSVCQLEHASCPDLRHYYSGCAFDHESERDGTTQTLQRKLNTLKSAHVPLIELPSTAFPFGQDSAFSSDERSRLIAIANMEKQLENEVTRLRSECQEFAHYAQHVIIGLMGEPSIEKPLTAYNRARLACIDSWKSEDRNERYASRKAEGETLHDGANGRFGRRFDPVAKDEYHRTRPDYFLIEYGISARSKQRIAIIRIPSTWINLQVEVSTAFQGISVSKKRRRAIFRSQAHPTEQEQMHVDTLCKTAIAEFWATR